MSRCYLVANLFATRVANISRAQNKSHSTVQDIKHALDFLPLAVGTHSHRVEHVSHFSRMSEFLR